MTGNSGAYDVISDVNYMISLEEVSNRVADLMRANHIKVANGDWNEYYRAIALADSKIHTKYKAHVRACVMEWCNVH
jgi:hypothetical protein